MARLGTDVTIPKPVREAALRLAASRVTSVGKLTDYAAVANGSSTELAEFLDGANATLRQRPTDFQGRLSLGIAQLGLGLRDEAIRTLEELRWPADYGPPGPEEGIRLSFITLIYLNKGDDLKAKKALAWLVDQLRTYPYWSERPDFVKAYREVWQRLVMPAPAPRKR